MVLLVVYSLVIWLARCLLYISMQRRIGMVERCGLGPWQAVALANFAFLVPSSPGGIGPFEWACKDALMRHERARRRLGCLGC